MGSKPSRSKLRAIAVEYFSGREKPFTPAEVSELLSVSRWTVNRLRVSGKLAALGVGRLKRYHVEDVYRYLMENTF